MFARPGRVHLDPPDIPGISKETSSLGKSGCCGDRGCREGPEKGASRNARIAFGHVALSRRFVSSALFGGICHRPQMRGFYDTVPIFLEPKRFHHHGGSAEFGANMRVPGQVFRHGKGKPFPLCRVLRGIAPLTDL
ncbi:hypothetical protein [Pseudooceanicola sp. 200-1SW]|uniref:hypothetical protein n=1 Tax=Pseudooceanicola sp. 200-1SW TaxID=3425949 RepID=UPI003D7FC59D